MPPVDGRLLFLERLQKQFLILTEGVSCADVNYQSLAKETARAVLGEIEKLIRDDDVTRFGIFPQRSNRADADDFIDP